MNIAIDVSPLKTGHYLQHRVRGTGFYLKNLQESLISLKSKETFIPFDRQGKISQKIDLLHIPYFEPFFLTLPTIKKQKTVVTVHDLTPLVFQKYFPPGLKGWLKWFLQKRALKYCDRIITDSISSKNDIAKVVGYPEEKIDVVYLAAGKEFKKLSDIEKAGTWKEEIKKKYNLPDTFLLYVGDVTWNKNLPRLIEAVKKADTPLVMVGKALTEENFDRSNPWNQDLVKVQELAIDMRILRLGFVLGDDLVKLYNLATAFIMPSIYEGFGLPILEAMACGCPVITSKEGSIPEVAGDAAYYVDAYDENTIADGIRNVIGNYQLRKELSSKGITQCSKFSWEKTAEETLKVYEKVLQGQ